MGNRLIQQRQGIAHRTLGGAGDQRQRIPGHGGPFGGKDGTQMGHHHVGFDAPEVIALAAGQDRDRNLADLGGGKDEFDVGGRLFQRLQQGVERPCRQHVHLVKDDDLVARFGGPVRDRRQDVAHLVDLGVRGRVIFQHIDMAAFGNGNAGAAGAAGLDRGACSPCRADAVQPFGDDAGRRGLAHAAHAGHHEGMRDPVRLERIAQGAHHRLLPDQVGKGLRPVFPGQNLIGGGVGHRGLGSDRTSLDGGARGDNRRQRAGA